MPRSRSTTKARKARQKALRAAKPEPNHPPKTVKRPALGLLTSLLKGR